MNAIVNFVTTIPIANIHPFEDNPYKVQDNEEMQFLCESIRENGILSPLLVRKIGAAEEYEVISGHRRLYAAHKLGLTGLPTVRPATPPLSLLWTGWPQVPQCGFRYRQRQRDVLEQCEINACTPSYSQAVLPQGLNAAETEDYVIKACEHYRKFQRRREQER